MTRKMKDSGIEWIGEMNISWKTAPLKFILKERRQKNSPIITKERLSLSIGIGVTLYSEKTTNLDRFKDDVTQYKVAYPNDLVINSMNVIVGAEGISNYLGCVSPAYYVMYSNNPQKFITKYYDYCFKTSTIQKALFYLGKGILAIDRGEGRVNTCRLKVSSYDLGRLEFPVPSINEQHRIVEFLDSKCNKIDQTIEKEKEVIEKLKEYKQSIITEAVTKGLNHDVKMKDSGVEWIGDIPEHWRICRLKNYASICNGQDYKGILDENGIYPVMGSGGAFAKANDFIYNKPSVLLGRKGTIDKPLYVDYPFWTVDTMYYTIINEKNYVKFFYYLCKTINFEYYQYGSAVPSMTQRDLNNIIFANPKLEEQKEIADYLDKKCSAIDKLITNKEKVIEKLTEYKKSLIYECVTGKREV